MFDKNRDLVLGGNLDDADRVRVAALVEADRFKLFERVALHPTNEDVLVGHMSFGNAANTWTISRSRIRASEAAGSLPEVIFRRREACRSDLEKLLFLKAGDKLPKLGDL